MQVTKILPIHTDTRGTIADILYKENINHVNIIHSNQGAIRGNHYHILSHQWIYMISGTMEYWWSDAFVRKPEMIMLHEGDLVSTPPNEIHALQMITPVTFIAMAKGLRGGEDYEKDTYRVKSIIGFSE